MGVCGEKKQYLSGAASSVAVDCAAVAGRAVAGEVHRGPVFGGGVWVLRGLGLARPGRARLGMTLEPLAF